MEKIKLVMADVLTFGMIALVAAIFGFSNAGPTPVLVGRVICYISLVLSALSLVVKRPPNQLR